MDTALRTDCSAATDSNDSTEYALIRLYLPRNSQLRVFSGKVDGKAARVGEGAASDRLGVALVSRDEMYPRLISIWERVLDATSQQTNANVLLGDLHWCQLRHVHRLHKVLLQVAMRPTHRVDFVSEDIEILLRHGYHVDRGRV